MKIRIAVLLATPLLSMSAVAGHWCQRHGRSHNNVDDGDVVIAYTSGECSNANASCYYKKRTYTGCEVVDGFIAPGQVGVGFICDDVEIRNGRPTGHLDDFYGYTGSLIVEGTENDLERYSCYFVGAEGKYDHHENYVEWTYNCLARE